jgi:DNA-binding MltR family transcriptional regulator
MFPVTCNECGHALKSVDDLPCPECGSDQSTVHMAAQSLATARATLETAPITQEDLMKILSRQTEAGNALVVAGIVEDWLEKLLLARGRTISNRTAKRIFEGMGPLSSFSGKIDVAYLFELIDEDVAQDLRVIKDIRNKFAHTTQSVHFQSEHIAKDCEKLSNWKPDKANEECYRDRAIECVNLMKAAVERFITRRLLKTSM